tara:strand:+ start:209 stop:355 length:147 start_codon:yes stop_codon:yes gene_type:complete
LPFKKLYRKLRVVTSAPDVTNKLKELKKVNNFIKNKIITGIENIIKEK